MKHIITVLLSIAFGFLYIPAFADQYVHGYTRSNGTYVHSYYRSSPDNTVTNNFSYKGNVNPYTGAIGRNRYIHDKTSPYFQGPDSHGRVGHASTAEAPAFNAADPAFKMLEPPPKSLGLASTAPSEPQGMRLPQVSRGPKSVSLCAPPHFTMTERDGCQPVR